MREEYEDFFAYQDERKVTVTVRETAEILGLHTNTIYKSQIAITSWTPRGKNLGHGWSRRIYR